jgi:hypothetical protein
VFDNDWVNTYWTFGEFCFLLLQGLRSLISENFKLIVTVSCEIRSNIFVGLYFRGMAVFRRSTFTRCLEGNKAMTGPRVLDILS